MRSYRRRLLLLVPLVLLGACSETATAPPTLSIPSTAAVKQVAHLATDAQEITVVRTTVVGKSRRVKVTNIKQGRGTITHGTKLTRSTPITAEEMIANGPPLPRLTYPSSSRNPHRGPWTQSAPYGVEPDAVMEWSGNNDEPASTMRLVRNGVSVYTITRQFQRSDRGWELVRQETIASNGMRDIIAITRSGGVQPLLSLAPLSPRGIAPTAPRLYGGEEGGCGGESVDIDVENKCKPYKDLADAQYVRAALVGATAAALCFPPQVLTPPGFVACAATTGLWVVEQKEFDRMYAEYLDCVKHYEDIITAKTSGPCEDPNDYDEYYPGGSGSGSGNSHETVGYTTCLIYIEYDMSTGEVYYAELLACW